MPTLEPAAGEVRLLSAVTSVDGVERCRLSGLIGDRPVVAQWDGRRLSLSEPLYQRAVLTVALDSLFAESGHRLAASRHRFALNGPVTEVMVTLAWSCDVVDVVEYRRSGVRRAILAVAGGSARAVDLENAPQIPG